MKKIYTATLLLFTVFLLLTGCSGKTIESESEPDTDTKTQVHALKRRNHLYHRHLGTDHFFTRCFDLNKRGRPGPAQSLFPPTPAARRRDRVLDHDCYPWNSGLCRRAHHQRNSQWQRGKFPEVSARLPFARRLLPALVCFRRIPVRRADRWGNSGNWCCFALCRCHIWLRKLIGFQRQSR